MKSHPYASKRRLTNICCLVVSLACIKLVFAAYVMAGGELFEFASKKELSPKASIIAREYEQNQQKIRDKNVIGNTTEHSAIGEKMTVSGVMQNTVPLLSSRVSFLPKGQAQNTQAQNSQKSNIQNPNSQENDVTDASIGSQRRIAHQVATQVNHLVGNQAGNQVSKATNPFVNAVAHQVANQATIQNTQAVNPNIVPASMMSSTFIQESPTRIEPSDMISNDAVLAQASSVTANIARAQVRANLLQNAFAQNQGISPTLLDGVETQKSNYSNSNLQAQRPSIKTKEKSSFFNFVGTAHAAEEPYIRQDEKTSVAIPPPTVAPYSSPESLEYRKSELNRKEEELLALQQQMNARMDELNKIEGRVTSMVQGANSAEDGRFKHLIDTYVSMKAKKAAVALTTLDEEIAVRILNGMKGKQAGEIFSYMDPVQAARLSEAMTSLTM